MCSQLDFPLSTYNYRKKEGKAGRKPSLFSISREGKKILNEEVVSKIESIMDHQFADYGYIKISHILRNRYGVIINRKKVYRLMKEAGYLQKLKREKANYRPRVANWQVNVSRPFEKIEIDIKYIYVKGEQRHYYMLNLIDCYSWKLLSYRLSGSIRKEDVIDMLRKVMILYGNPKDIMLRSDNGSQFISKDMAAFIDRTINMKHEFCHVRTPQENGYVECFHSILQRFIVKREGFESFSELEKVLKTWTEFYNEERPHKGCGYRTPSDVMSGYYEKTGKNIGKVTA